MIVSAALFLDIITSSVDVNIQSKSHLDSSGNKVTSMEVVYPLWHQVISLVINFLYGLAAAVFITVFVANKLQKSQQEEKENELNKLNTLININVFDGLFKTIIPEEIFKVIKQEIIESKVLRKEAKWIYDFSIQDGKILARMTTRYELHNLSQHKVTDPIKLELDTLGGNAYKVVSAECLNRSGEVVVRYVHDDLDNNKNVDVEHHGTKTIVKYGIEIPSENYVEYKTITERIYEGDIVDSQATKVPVIGADIIVNFPEEYNFDISPTMSSKPRLITDSSTQKIYKVEGGILPWQGFSFYLVKQS